MASVKRMNVGQAEKYVAYQRHILLKLRDEMVYTRRPDIVQDSIDYARLSIICGKRGYMLMGI